MSILKVIAHKSDSGQICLNLARKHLKDHEWGQARMALEAGLAKGGLNDLEEATNLLRDIYERLGARHG